MRRARAASGVAGDIGQGEERFGGVHVAVGAAIGLGLAPVAVEDSRMAPSSSLQKYVSMMSIASSSRPGRRDARHHRRAGGQGDEGMQVGGLAGVAVAVFGDGEPAAVLGITQRAAQGRDAVLDQLGNPASPGYGPWRSCGSCARCSWFRLARAPAAAFVIEVAEALGQRAALANASRRRPSSASQAGGQGRSANC
jgi:hypothetical protein